MNDEVQGCSCCCHGPADRRLAVGDRLYGFCRGYFGRDSYGDKVVEAIGWDWVLCREDNGNVVVAYGNPDRLAQYRTKPIAY